MADGSHGDDDLVRVWMPLSPEIGARAIREEAREIDYVCSTTAEDTYGTVLEQDWDLSRYEANPVVLFAHDTRSKPIGQGRSVAVKTKKLNATVWFSEATQDARDCWALAKEGTLRGISVGFRPGKITYDEKNDVVILSENVLYELSLCPVPSNPDALAKLRARAIGATRIGQSPSGSEATTQTDKPADARGDGDKTMGIEVDTKGFEARIADLTTKNAELATKATDAEARATKAESERDAAASKATALESQNKVLVGERDEFKARAEKLEGEKIEQAVKALVGRKYPASELEKQLEFARKDFALWGELANQRSDMPHLETKIPEDKDAAPRKNATERAQGADGTRDADALAEFEKTRASATA